MGNLYLLVLMSIFFVLLPGPDLAITRKNTITIGEDGGLNTVAGL